MKKPISILAMGKMETHKAITFIRMLWPMMTYGERPDFECKYLDAGDVQELVATGKENLLHGYDIYVMGRIIGPTRKEGSPFFFIDDPDTQKVVLEVDDDLTGQHRDYGVGEWLDQTMRYVDAVTVSTPHLAKVMESSYDKPAYVLPNYLRTDFYRDVSMQAVRNHPDVITIGVCGTKTHWGDYALVLGALQGLQDKYGDKVMFVCGNYKPDFFRHLDGVRFIPGQTYELYPGMLRQFDIRLCPLESGELFNESKSPIAALEAMAAGRPVGTGVGGAVAVCSNHGVYRSTINNGVNGFLANDNEWYDILDELVSDEKLREKVSVQGHRWVVKNRDIRDHGSEWARAYKTISRRGVNG